MEIALFNALQLNRRGETPQQVLAATVEMVRCAEELGFDSAWFAEHHVSSFGVCPSPLMLAAHCAGVTRRIRLGPAVIVLPLYQPIRLIEEIGLADALSGGRLLLGFGNGHQPQEFRSLGVPVADRHGRAAEIWDILEMGLATGHVEHHGKFFDIAPTAIAMRPLRMPPRFLAAADPLLVARAARAGATPFISQGHRDLKAALEMRRAVEDAYREAGFTGPAFPLAVQRYVFVTEDRGEAVAAAEGLRDLARKMTALRQEYPERDGVHIAAPPFAGEPDLDWLLEHAPIGDPERCAERLIAEIDQLRPRHMSFFMGFTALEHARVRRSLELFGREVLPRLRAHTGGPPG